MGGVDTLREGSRESISTAGAATLPAEGSNRLSEVPDLYWRALESGGVWYTSRQLRQVVRSRISTAGAAIVPAHRRRV